ncbi:MAG: acyltransferase [Ruminococcus sp.]|nr:acyltransferase [Ruminococcus sp.]
MTKKRLFQTLVYNLQRGNKAKNEYLVRKKLVAGIGENVTTNWRKIPLYSELIKLHSNIMIASGVHFVTHDAVNYMLTRKEGTFFPEQIGCIEIMDNVFIGTETVILYGVRIGKNVIIGANTLVNRDLEEGYVYAGIPARKICTFDEFVEKRRKSTKPTVKKNQSITVAEIKAAWRQFDSSHKGNKDG